MTLTITTLMTETIIITTTGWVSHSHPIIIIITNKPKTLPFPTLFLLLSIYHLLISPTHLSVMVFLTILTFIHLCLLCLLNQMALFVSWKLLVDHNHKVSFFVSYFIIKFFFNHVCIMFFFLVATMLYSDGVIFIS